MLRRTTSSFNKAEVLSHLGGWICNGELLLPAGHGGEGAEQLFTPRSSSRGWRSWRLCILVFCHGTDLSSGTILVKPSRWRRVAGGIAGEVFFFNKWRHLLFWILLLLRPSPLTGRGAMERGLTPAMLCGDGGGGGAIDLNHVGGMLASMIFCRHGGVPATFGEEALLRSRGGCSKRPSGEVIRSL
jgi:hypothetical protein